MEAPAEVRQVRERDDGEVDGPEHEEPAPEHPEVESSAHRPGLRGAPAIRRRHRHPRDCTPAGAPVRREAVSGIAAGPAASRGACRAWRPSLVWAILDVGSRRRRGLRLVERHEADPRARVEARRRAGLPLAQAPRPAAGPARVRLPLLRHARPSSRPSRRHAALPHREAPAALAGQAARGGRLASSWSCRARRSGSRTSSDASSASTRAAPTSAPIATLRTRRVGRPRARAGTSGRRGGAGLGGGARRAEGQAALSRGRGRAGRRPGTRRSSSASAPCCGRGGATESQGTPKVFRALGLDFSLERQASGPVRHPGRPRAGRDAHPARRHSRARSGHPARRGSGGAPPDASGRAATARRPAGGPADVRAAARSTRSGRSWPGSVRRSAVRATSTCCGSICAGSSARSSARTAGSAGRSCSRLEKAAAAAPARSSWRPSIARVTSRSSTGSRRRSRIRRWWTPDVSLADVAARAWTKLRRAVKALPETAGRRGPPRGPDQGQAGALCRGAGRPGGGSPRRALRRPGEEAPGRPRRAPGRGRGRGAPARAGRGVVGPAGRASSPVSSSSVSMRAGRRRARPSRSAGERSRGGGARRGADAVIA